MDWATKRENMDFKNELEYLAALKRLDVVFMADKDTPEGKEASVLVDAIVDYERVHYPIGPPEIDLNLIVDPEDNIGVVHGGIADVPLIESIVSRAGNTLKLRFLDGSVGIFDTDGFIPPRQLDTAHVGGGLLGYTDWREDPYHMTPIALALDPIVVWNNTKFL